MTVTEDIAVAAPASRAAGSSFYSAMRILPRVQRQAMFEIYSFCRAVDDIADHPGDREWRRRQLGDWRWDIDALYLGRGPARLRGLAWAVHRFDLRRNDFLAIIDGMEMDVISDIRAPDLGILEVYCDRVASAVGRLSVKVFGMDDKAGRELSHHLGRALQFTNILRDLDEDAAMGRLYLPRETLVAAQIKVRAPAAVLDHSRLADACNDIVSRARVHFREADRIMAAAPRRVVRAPRIMSAAYQLILEELVARGWAAPRAPVRLSRSRLLLIVLRYALI